MSVSNESFLSIAIQTKWKKTFLCKSNTSSFSSSAAMNDKNIPRLLSKIQRISGFNLKMVIVNIFKEYRTFLLNLRDQELETGFLHILASNGQK